VDRRAQAVPLQGLPLLPTGSTSHAYECMRDGERTRACVALQEITPRQHRKLLQKHRHLRYMWIPHTDAVVVVTNDPVKEVQ
jgi:hypothetical protein